MTKTEEKIEIPPLADCCLARLREIANHPQRRSFALVEAHQSNFREELQHFASFGAHGLGDAPDLTGQVVIFHFSLKGQQVLELVRDS